MFAAVLESAVSLSDAELDEAVRASELALREQQARHAALIAVAESRGLHRVDGHHTMSGYLRATVNASPGEVAKLRTLADVCGRVPELGEALAAGRVGRSQIEQIARIHTNPRTRDHLPAVADIYLERAELTSHADLRREIDQFLQFADEDGAFADVASQVEHRTATVSNAGGSLSLRADGGEPIGAARIAAIFEHFAEHELTVDLAARTAEYGDDANGQPLRRTASQRRFDALMRIFETAAAPRLDGTTAVETVVDIVIDQRSLDDAFTRHGLLTDTIDTLDDDQLDDTITGLVATAQHDPLSWVDRRCETADGGPIHPMLALRAALTGHIRRVVVDSAGTVIDLGRKQRLFTGAAREAAKLLVHRCDHPGCVASARHADVDHLDEWHAGGRTDQMNAGIECRSHNRFKHRERWRVERDPEGRRFSIRPDGTVVLPVGTRMPGIPSEHDRMVRERLERLLAA